MKKTFQYFPLLLISFLFVTLFSRSTSFLYLFEGADPSIFKQMGRALLNGKILYIDYFDNKGCLLYFIHALALWLGGDIFLLFFQTISLFVTLLIWNKMLTLYQSRRQRMICLAVALTMLFCFYGAGDQTQEWCLPFISYPLLLFLQAYKAKSEIPQRQLFLIGLCFGVITFIQINNACAFLGFVAYYWIQCLLKKEFRQLFRSVGLFLAGWLVVVIPCVLYFYFKAGWHGVYEMVYASFLSNFEYMGIQHRRKWIYWLPYLVFLLSLLLLKLLNYRKDKDLLIPFLISLSLFVGTFGKLCNSFYLIAIVPLVIVGLMKINLKEHKIVKVYWMVTASICVLFMGSISVFHVVNDLFIRNEKEVEIYEDFHRCVENIPENERDSIYNYNLFWHGTSMMEHEELVQCNRALYSTLAFELPTLKKEEQSKHLMPPKWIMVSYNMKYYVEDVDFIQTNYDLCCEFHYDRLYLRKPLIGNEFKVCFYQRKPLTR